MDRSDVLKYLKDKKEELYSKYGIVTLGLYGSYARDEATEKSDVDIFYEIDDKFSMGLFEYSAFLEKLAKELNVKKVDFVKLSSMNPIIKYYAKKDFIYV